MLIVNRQCQLIMTVCKKIHNRPLTSISSMMSTTSGFQATLGGAAAARLYACWARVFGFMWGAVTRRFSERSMSGSAFITGFVRFRWCFDDRWLRLAGRGGWLVAGCDGSGWLVIGDGEFCDGVVCEFLLELGCGYEGELNTWNMLKLIIMVWRSRNFQIKLVKARERGGVVGPIFTTHMNRLML